MRPWYEVLTAVTAASVAVGIYLAQDTTGRGETSHRVGIGRKARLPLPSTKTLEGFEETLYDFLDRRMYDEQPGHLGWVRDKGVRDTGAYLNKTYHGTHPAVRIYYSPEVLAWLQSGRSGTIPDGAMMIKEQYPPPAARWVGKSEEELREGLESWTVMVRDRKGSHDGWFWSYYAPRKKDGTVTQEVDGHEYPFKYPDSGFGLYCVRCHASAERESTFASLRNIEGFPGQPLTFLVDDSWKAPPAPVARESEPTQVVQTVSAKGTTSGQTASVSEKVETQPDRSGSQADPKFLAYFDAMSDVPRRRVVKIPNQTYDHVVPGAKQHSQFWTSDQCLPCHDGLAAPNRTMFHNPDRPEEDLPFGSPKGVNVSPFGEWQWSMMGLSGRDPVFHAQFEGELRQHGRTPAMRGTISDACASCHGVMGLRQWDIDHEGKGRTPFEHDTFLVTDQKDPRFHYGALARDGVSCMVCHRIQSQNQSLAELITGHFQTGPADQVFGPYHDEEVATVPMANGLGLTPKHSPHLNRSRLCATCHVVRLPVYHEGEPVLDAEGKPRFEIEQATYLEWVNSQYEDEYHPGNPLARSCQQCHMPGQYHGRPVRDRIATIEDDTYPEAEYRVPDAQVHIRKRDGYARHELLGINVPVLEMFRQFDDILGVRKTDYMTGSPSGLPHAIENAVDQARTATARVRVSDLTIREGTLRVDVTVTNLAGHRFPSGVGFRRAFLELAVFDTRGGRERLAWASGRTNELGVLVDAEGKPLPSETLAESPDGENQFQPHYTQDRPDSPGNRPIRAQDQVQIYEELTQDAAGRFTTSFLALARVAKDNRLLPQGWSRQGPPNHDLPPEFLHATFPVGAALADPDYRDGSGTDTVSYLVPLGDLDPRRVRVEATLYYQSIPPSYLGQRFATVPDGRDTQRLYYLASHLNLGETPLSGWKLRVASDTTPVRPSGFLSGHPHTPGETAR